MAGHGWRDWFEREEFIGQISDIRVQNLQVEREVVQKRTFTRWMNLHLEKCNPPMEVHDLFRDIQDGRILMALLEELSGCKLLHGFKKSSHRIFRLNNIAKVLSFLEERNVKLVSIDAADVADGNSSIVLGLIWNIILFFQIKELTGNIRSQFPSSSSLSSIPTSSDSDTSYSSTPSEERRPSSGAIRDHGKPIKKLLQWVQKRTRKYGVAVQDFGKSWTSGLAFLAVIKSIDSSLVDMRRAMLRTARENLEDAFRTAHYSLGIPRLLEPEDVTINSPDEQSIMTYVSQFLEHFPGIEEPEEACQVIERSVSMGRLSSCDSDFDQIRNGMYRSHLRERPYTVRKDWVQPPPKIFISSVSEDRGFMSPTSPSAGARSWASEDSLIGSTPIEDRSTSVGGDPHDPGREVFTISNSNSPVSESVNSESVIGDSAISSPDSWVESEVGAMQDRFGESRSNSFLCDSETAWDVGVLPATPEEVTTLDEGLMPSKVERLPNEQSISELFIDEGIYLSSSLESTQERIQAQSEKEEEEKQVEEKEANCYLQDLNQDRAPTHVPDQNEAERKALQKDQVSSEQQPSLRLSDATEQTNSGVVHSLEPNGTNQSQPSSSLKPLTLGLSEEPSEQEARSHTESECAKEAVEFSGNSQVPNDPAEQDKERKRGPQREGPGGDEDLGLAGSSGSQGFDKDVDSPENEAPNKMNCTSSEHDNKDPESALFILGGLLSEKVKPIASEQTREIENGHLNDINQHGTVRSSNTDSSGPVAIDHMEISETQQKCGSPHHGHSHHDRTTTDDTETLSLTQPPSTDAERHPVPSDQDIETNSTDQLNVQDKLGTTFPTNETAIAQQNTPENLRSNGETGTTCYEPTSEAGDMDLFYADRSSPSEELVNDLVDPMDLFYPDKEESLFTEPPDREIKSQLSVLSVSALQPAPASETLPEAQPPNQLGEDFKTGVVMQEQEKEIPETHRGADTPSEPREQCLLPGEGAVAGWGVGELAEGSDLSQASARENMEPMRSEAKSSRRQDESPVPTAAHHRKVASSVESTDNHMTASTTGTQGDNSDLGPSEGSELYLLLLLWLLLYCLLLLPQMDLKTLPGLLLNLDH